MNTTEIKVQIQGFTKVRAKDGIFNFTNMTMIAFPGNETTIKFSSNILTGNWSSSLWQFRLDQISLDK
jgi:hypothetical protein